MFFFFFLPVAQNSPCIFTLILPAWVPHNVIKPQRSTKLSSFNDVQHAMPQKIRSTCLHDSRIGTYPIYFHIWMRPESDLAISECMRFFPVYTVIEQIRSVSHMSKKIGIGSHLTDSVNGAFRVERGKCFRSTPGFDHIPLSKLNTPRLSLI